MTDPKDNTIWITNGSLGAIILALAIPMIVQTRQGHKYFPYFDRDMAALKVIIQILSVLAIVGFITLTYSAQETINDPDLTPQKRRTLKQLFMGVFITYIVSAILWFSMMIAYHSTGMKHKSLIYVSIGLLVIAFMSNIGMIVGSSMVSPKQKSVAVPSSVILLLMGFCNVTMWSKLST